MTKSTGDRRTEHEGGSRDEQPRPQPRDVLPGPGGERTQQIPVDELKVQLIRHDHQDEQRGLQRGGHRGAGQQHCGRATPQPGGTTGLGKNIEPWSDLLTVVDLATGEAARVRTRAGEPGVTVLGGGDPLVVLRHRQPGALAAHRFADLLAARPGCPTVTPDMVLPLPDDGHGDAQDPDSGRVFAATSEGVHPARRMADGLAAEAVIPWESPARGWYLRLDTHRRALWSTLRGGHPEPLRWPDWTNQAWRHDLVTGRTHLTDLGPGLVFRLALARDHTVFTHVHPDGDELVLLCADETLRRVPLPAMDGAPSRGGTPWEGVQRRAVAASPGSDWVAVTRGGHGEVHIFDAGRITRRPA